MPKSRKSAKPSFQQANPNPPNPTSKPPSNPKHIPTVESTSSSSISGTNAQPPHQPVVAESDTPTAFPFLQHAPVYSSDAGNHEQSEGKGKGTGYAVEDLVKEGPFTPHAPQYPTTAATTPLRHGGTPNYADRDREIIEALTHQNQQLYALSPNRTRTSIISG